MSPVDPDEQRANSREAWERAAAGWGKHADFVRKWGMPVSAAMIDRLALQPGQRVLELAAGPGDTGFMALELVQPGGTLVSSDGAEAMLEIARSRARKAGIESSVEFKLIDLEWIDLETASVDAALCRWGIMLIVDPEAAAREVRRVLRPGGRAAFAVWDVPDRNPWATIPSRALIELGHAEPPDPEAPGMFALAPAEKIQELLQGAGFVEVSVLAVGVERRYERLEQFIQDTTEISPLFGATVRELSESDRAAVQDRIEASAAEYTADDGSVVLPGRSLVAVGSA
ncbi:MAG TPA: methyltransferase domain-containing protein [Solirubrobacteraceae bacterium]